MTRRSARDQSLPEEEIALLATLTNDQLRFRCKQLYQAGWTLRAIGESTDPERSRSTIRTWITQPLDEDLEPSIASVPVPTYRTDPEYVKKRPTSPGIPVTDMQIIKDCAPVAKKYRSGMSSISRASIANNQLTQIVVRLHDNGHGVPVQELADAASVSYRAMARRLGKLG